MVLELCRSSCDLEVTSGWFGQDQPSDQTFESVLCSFTEACEGELSRLSLAFIESFPRRSSLVLRFESGVLRLALEVKFL